MADKASRHSGAGPVPGRSTSRASNVLSVHLDDDEEDFALAAMGISDSYRPTPSSPNSQYRPVPSALADIPSAVRPSSVAKVHRPRDSFTLRHDGPNGHDGSSTSARTDASSASSALLNRTNSVSTISTSPFVSPEDPYEGPSGPSHPYQMYPQNVRLARTASLATTSTAPVSEQSYNGPRGPTHPYMMYPQHTVAEANTSDEHSPMPIPSNVGFPGSTDRYQRRIGPDGEEAADLIGPDGHTEQLPPYSRYPDEAYHRKALGVQVPTPQSPQATSSQSATTAAAIPGAGGIGMATRNPEFSSTEDLGGDDVASPFARQSVRSFASEQSHHEINTAAAAIVNEKASPRDWRDTVRKRVWGIVPCWAVGLAVLILVLMGVVVGTVIGTLLAPKIAQEDQKPSASSSYPCDFKPIQVAPPGLPALMTGEFALPLSLSNTASQCVKNTTQAQAWNCAMIPAQLSLNITAIQHASATEAYTMSFGWNENVTTSKNAYYYGMQPPEMQNAPLLLVTDLYQDDRGPAWFFETEYRKTVIIPEKLLSPKTSPAKRGSDPFGDGFYPQDSIEASPGDRPWICYWEKTVFEVFIYVTQNNSLRSISSNNYSGGSSGSSYSSSSSSTSTSTTLLTQLYVPPIMPPIISPGTQTFQIPSPSPTASPSPYNNALTKPSYGRHGAEPLPTNVERNDLPAPNQRGAMFASSVPKPGSKLPHPNVIKIVERRGPYNADTGFCRQFEIKGPGEQAVPIVVNNAYIEIYLDETFSTPKSSVKARDIIKDYMAQRDSDDVGSGSASGTEMSDCGCMWWLN